MKMWKISRGKFGKYANQQENVENCVLMKMTEDKFLLRKINFWEKDFQLEKWKNMLENQQENVEIEENVVLMEMVQKYLKM